MAATTENSIWFALRSRIETIPLSPLPHRAYPGKDYEPTGADYLSIGGISLAPERRSVGPGSDERVGTLGIVYVAALGRYPQDFTYYLDKAGQIAAHFPKDLPLYHGGVKLQIMDTPHVQDGYREGAYWHVPVTIRWRCFTR